MLQTAAVDTMSHADRSLVSMHIAYFKIESHNMSLTQDSINMFLKFVFFCCQSGLLEVDQSSSGLTQTGEDVLMG